jgi:hypothetical protein
VGHSRLAPSNTKRWTKCPGSVKRVASIPEECLEGSSEYSRLGTAAHGLLERTLDYTVKQGKTGHTPADYKGRIIELVGADEDISILRANAKAPKGTGRVWFEVDDDMIEAVDEAYQYVLRRIEELGIDSDGVLLERRVTPLTERDDNAGTADVTLDAWPDLLEVADYKHGSGVLVEVIGNEQLRSYILGAARESNFSHARYKYTVIQPRAAHTDGHIRSEEMTREELMEWHQWLLKRAAKTDAPDAPLIAGPHCQETFCPAKSWAHNGTINMCPALKAAVEEQTQADFADDVPDRHAQPLLDDIEAVSRVLAWVPVIDAWARDLEASAQRLAESGTKIPAFKLVRKRSNRTFVAMVPVLDEAGEPVLNNDDEPVLAEADDASISAYIVGKGWVDNAGELFSEPKLKTGPQIEKVLPKEHRKAFNEELLYKPEGGLTLAPESDDRPEVTIDASADFEGEEL